MVLGVPFTVVHKIIAFNPRTILNAAVIRKKNFFLIWFSEDWGPKLSKMSPSAIDHRWASEWRFHPQQSFFPLFFFAHSFVIEGKSLPPTTIKPWPISWPPHASRRPRPAPCGDASGSPWPASLCGGTRAPCCVPKHSLTHWRVADVDWAACGVFSSTFANVFVCEGERDTHTHTHSEREDVSLYTFCLGDGRVVLCQTSIFTHL